MRMMRERGAVRPIRDATLLSLRRFRAARGFDASYKAHASPPHNCFHASSQQPQHRVSAVSVICIAYSDSVYTVIAAELSRIASVPLSQAPILIGNLSYSSG